MEDSNPNQIPPESPSASPQKKVVDRVTLGAEESERADAWISQLRESSKGFLDLTKSDLINFLIRAHARELTVKEIKAIRTANYDPIRHLNWITPRLKDALAKRDMDQVASPQSEIRGIELSVITRATELSKRGDPSPVPMAKGKRRRKSESLAPVEVSSAKETLTNLPEG